MVPTAALAQPPLSTTRCSSRLFPDHVLESVIRGGRPGTLMPAFAEDKGGTLTAGQVHALAVGLKSHWPPAPPKGVNLPPYSVVTNAKRDDSAAAIQRGASAFERACAGCHGTNGEGDSAGAIADPAFLALISDQALRRLIITGRPDLEMPNYAQTDGRDDDFRPLTSAEISDLVAFVRHTGTKPPRRRGATVPLARIWSHPSPRLCAGRQN